MYIKLIVMRDSDVHICIQHNLFSLNKFSVFTV